MKRLRSLAGRVYRRLLRMPPTPFFDGTLHGFPAELNEGNTYPAIVATSPMFNAPLVELVCTVARQLKRKISFIDVGAACGDTVLLLERRCPDMVDHYLCIEGDAEFCGYLRKNTARFQHVKIAQALLAGERMQVPELVKHHRGSAGCFGEKNAEAQPLDDVSSANSFKADILKIDVDGFDGEVLRGSRNLLSRDRPAVIFEWHPKLSLAAGQDPRTSFAVLAECGYHRFVWFDNQGEFSHFSSVMDSDTLLLTRDFLLAVNERRDQHFDVIALCGDDHDQLISLATLEYARKAAQERNRR